jgi:uncharacterized membrane protein YcaP (DUF421 family)
MWSLVHPWWEYVLRSAVIYWAVFTLLRLIGKKQTGEMSPFDLVLLLIVSESVSASITGGDDSLSAGLICVSTFVIGNYLVDILSHRFKRVEKVLDGEAVKIIDHGILDNLVCNREHITFDEVASALREHGIGNIQEVEYATLETNGKITIVKAKNKEEVLSSESK